MRKTLLLSAFIPALIISCSTEDAGHKIPVDPTLVGEKYTTTSDQKILFRKEVLNTTIPEGKEDIIRIYTNQRQQVIEGFGGAMTGASCYNLLQMTPEDRTAFLKEMYDPVEGLGSSLIRVSIGASDFSVNSEFTWCDTPGIENFAIPQEDRDYLIPILKEIYRINPGVKIIASPWSAPLWMKTKQTWTHSQLNPQYYSDYALYFVKWIKAMEAEGFNIHAITVQNEPLNGGNSMSMYMTWQEQRDFIKQALGKAFADNNIKARILVWDHNYSYGDAASGQGDYPLKIYADKEASKYIAGSAWHNYGGSVTELQNIITKAPDKEIYFTEASIGEWNHGQPNGFAKCLMNDFENIFIGTMNYNGKGVTLWNFLLDTNNGPHRGEGACSTCYGIATIDPVTKKIVRRNSQYYDIAHASKVVKPGARRVVSVGITPKETRFMTFVNPDGSVAVLIVNKSETEQEFAFQSKKKVYTKVPPKSIVSLKWIDE